jgi:dTDP-4-amino-4,6-dideoxygalactose transaminase
VIKDEVAAAIARVLESSHFVLGDEVAAFEEEFAAYCEARHAVALNSGTSALHLALLAAGVRAGHEVITAPNTFIATCEAISYTGARPVFVDVDPATHLLDVMGLETAITPRTRAIIPVHLYGQPADLDPMLEVARRHGLAVVEDACQAHGARYKGRRVGALGLAGCFSFYPAKNLGAYGDGGALVTNDATVAETVRRLRDHGQSRRYYHDTIGYNYRLDALQAAILRVKLRYLDAWTAARRRHAARYTALLADTRVVTLAEASYAQAVYHLYVVQVPDRDALREELARAGIDTGIHYPVPCHLQRAYADLGHKPGDFPNAERAAASILSLPMYPELTEAQMSRVVSLVTDHVTGMARAVVSRDALPAAGARRPASITIGMTAFNEAAVIADTIGECLEVLDQIPGKHSVLVVNDGSTDETAAILHKLAATEPRVHVLTNEVNQGFAAGVRRLLREAPGDLVFYLAADGEWRPRELFGLVDKLAEGYDLVIGVRRKKHYGFYRQATSWIFNQLVRVLFGVNLQDVGSITLAHSWVWKRIAPRSDTAFACAEVLLLAWLGGARIGFTPVDHVWRSTGRSKFNNPLRAIEAFVELFTFRMSPRSRRKMVHGRGTDLALSARDSAKLPTA